MTTFTRGAGVAMASAIGATVLLAAPAQADDYETFHTYGSCFEAQRAYADAGATIVRSCFPVRVSGGYETYYRFIYRH